MKAGPFNAMIAAAFSVEEKTVTVFARALKEARLLTTGARGVNAPDMTPLDAARMTIALLACDGPAQAVERVKLFGQLRYSPHSTTSQAWREIVGQDEFASRFGGDTLEEVLAFIYSAYLDRGLDDGSRWFNDNVVSLTIRPGDVRAELVAWVHDANGKIVRERVMPFQGSRHAEGFVTIPRGLLVERSAAPATLSLVSVELWADAREEG